MWVPLHSLTKIRCFTKFFIVAYSMSWESCWDPVTMATLISSRFSYFCLYTSSLTKVCCGQVGWMRRPGSVLIFSTAASTWPGKFYTPMFWRVFGSEGVLHPPPPHPPQKEKLRDKDERQNSVKNFYLKP